MRRFFAFIVMVICLLGVSVFNIQTQVEKTRYGLEFENGYEVVYRITPDDPSKFNISDAADLMHERLEAAEVKNIYIEPETDKDSEDQQIRIALSANSTTNLENVLRSVEAQGTVTVCTSDDTECEEAIITRNSAEVKYQGSTAYVSVDIVDTARFQTLIDHANSLVESSGSEEEEAEEVTGELIFWMNKTESDTFDKATEDTNAAVLMQRKIISRASTSNYSSTDKKITLTTVGYSSATLNSESAHSLARTIKASDPDFEITRLYTNLITPLYGNNGVNKIVLALGIAIVLLCLGLMASYGWIGLAGSVASFVTIFFELFVYNFFGFVVTPVVLIGVIALFSICSLIVITYAEKVKNEVYNGKSLSKANTEGYKKTLSTVLDSAILILIIGVVTVLIGQQSMQYFSITLIISSLLGLIFCNLLFKWMMYWLCNNKFIQSHLKQIGINKDKIITNAMRDEMKETDKELALKANKIQPMNHKKKSFISALCCFVIALGSLLTFSLTSTTFNHTADFSASTRIQITTTAADLFSSNDEVVAFFEENNSIKLDVNEVSIVVVEDLTREGNYEIAYITVEANFSTDDVTLIDNITLELAKLDNEATLFFSDVDSVLPQKNFNNSLVLILVTGAIILVYFGLRFRYSIGIASFAVVLLQGIVTLGFFSLTRIAVDSYLGIGVFGGIVITILSQIPLFERMKQLKREWKVKAPTFEEKAEIVNTSLNQQVLGMIKMIGFVCLTIVGLMIVSPSSMLTVYLAILISTILGFVGTVFILVPVYLFLEERIKFKWYRKMKAKSAEKRANKLKAKSKIKKTGSEAEEALIPGINC